MIAKLVIWLMGRKTFSEKERLSLVNAVLRNIDAVPLRALIDVDDNRRILVRGKLASTEDLIVLQQSADTALNSVARNLIHEQVRFMAIDKGYLQSDDPKTQLFYKAALWFAQQENDLLKQMAGTYTQPE